MALYSHEPTELWPYGAMALYIYGTIKLCKAYLINDHKGHNHRGHDYIGHNYTGHDYTGMQEHLDQMLLTATDMH